MAKHMSGGGKRGFPGPMDVEKSAWGALSDMPPADLYGASEVEKHHENPANDRMGIYKKVSGGGGNPKGMAKSGKNPGGGGY